MVQRTQGTLKFTALVYFTR